MSSLAIGALLLECCKPTEDLDAHRCFRIASAVKTLKKLVITDVMHKCVTIQPVDVSWDSKLGSVYMPSSEPISILEASAEWAFKHVGSALTYLFDGEIEPLLEYDKVTTCLE